MFVDISPLCQVSVAPSVSESHSSTLVFPAAVAISLFFFLLVALSDSLLPPSGRTSHFIERMDGFDFEMVLSWSEMQRRVKKSTRERCREKEDSTVQLALTDKYGKYTDDETKRQTGECSHTCVSLQVLWLECLEEIWREETASN